MNRRKFFSLASGSTIAVLAAQKGRPDKLRSPHDGCKTCGGSGMIDTTPEPTLKFNLPDWDTPIFSMSRCPDWKD